MKKVILTIAMTMFMSMGFAVNNLDFNVRRLAEKLQLTTEQIESVQIIKDCMIREISEAEELEGFERSIGIRKAINKDIRSMRYVLTSGQFNEYVVLLFTTIRNNFYNEING